jgi:hypothetical protein
MNVYQKLQKCRVELQKKNLKKSGNNKFAGYSYYELQDFMPTINELFEENGLCGVVSFTNELATLTIYNNEKFEEHIVFTSPMSEAQLKGCHPVQNLGAVETYERRYLYMSALEITENDALDQNVGKEQTKPPVNKPKQTTQQQTGIISEAQRNRLFAISKGNNELLKEIITNHGYTSSKEIKSTDYEKICKEVEERVK